MKAVVLVGGFGTRLRPLTLSVPKQMLPVGGVTMLERVVARLGSFGITEAVLSLGYQPDQIIDRFPDGVCAGVSLTYAVEPEPRDTAGAIRFAAQAAGLDETFVALNGDVLTDLDLAGLVDTHRRAGGLATIALTPVEDPSRYGVVTTDENSRVLEFVEKPAPGTAPSNWINAGTYVLEPEVLGLIPEAQPTSIERQTFPELVDRGELFAFHSEAYWLDAGTPDAYLSANLDLIDGKRGQFEVGVDREAVVDPTAKVTHSIVGPGAVIAPGCSVVDSVIMAGARIGAGARLDRAIVGARSVVGESSALSGLTVVGFDYDVAAGTVGVGETYPSRESW